MKHILSSLIAIFCLLACSQRPAYQSYTDTIQLNGQSLFYAVEGAGKPVLLIHGNGGSHNDLETTQRQLAQAGYLVYAIDSRGQGANMPLPEYHYADMAEDMFAFIQAKHILQPAVFGWSDGGIIALILESTHPGTTSLLVTAGANVTAENAIDPQLFDEIFGTSDNLNNLPPLVRMMRLEPNMTTSDLSRIQIPVLVCAGEHDLILPEHTRFIADNLPRGQMHIVEGGDHGSYIWHCTQIGDILLDFFRQHNY